MPDGKHEVADPAPASWAPHPKVAIGGIAAATATILVWFASLAHVDMPPEVAGAITTVIGFVVGYFVPAEG